MYVCVGGKKKKKKKKKRCRTIAKNKVETRLPKRSPTMPALEGLCIGQSTDQIKDLESNSEVSVLCLQIHVLTLSLE
jgi:hypothetical protein